LWRLNCAFCLTILRLALKSVGNIINLIFVLVIRLSRSGRTKQASYRLVVAEKTAPIKGRFVEIVGYYNPSEGKKFEFKKDRVEYWISVGARPSDTVASLLKANGVDGLDDFIAPRTKKRSKKNPTEEEAAPAAAPAEESASAEEAPKEEPKEEEAPAEETPKEEVKEVVVADAPIEESEAPEETPEETSAE
jgi:small subunit ribosomal protein S16